MCKRTSFFLLRLIRPFNSLLKLSTHLLPLSLLVLFLFPSLLFLVIPPTPLYHVAHLPIYLKPLLLVIPLLIRIVSSEPIKNQLPQSPVKISCKRSSMTSQAKSLFLLRVSQGSPPQHPSLLMLGPAVKTTPPFCVSIVKKVFMIQLGVISSRKTLKPIWSPTRKELHMCSPLAHVFPMMCGALFAQWCYLMYVVMVYA